jgi:hypothetical protein
MKHAVLVLVLLLSACGGSNAPPPEPMLKITQPSTPDAAVGQQCTSSDDCPGAMCRGEEGCGTAWTCQPDIPCTRDLVQYCACDGTTFEASGHCPGRPFRHVGPCT